MSRLTTANQAVEDAVLAALRDAPTPLPIRELRTAVGGRLRHGDVYVRLTRMERVGLVERLTFPGMPATYWRSV